MVKMGFHSITLLSFLFLLSFCQPKAKRNSDKQVFRYNEASGITSLDPAYAVNQANIWGTNQLFNGLVQLNDRLEIIPAIAHSWDISPDGLNYSFHLRTDVFFHDHDGFPGGKGEKVTAADFVYSFNRILDPTIASPGAWVFNYVNRSNGKPMFTVENDSTLHITLMKSFPPFLSLLSMQYCAVVPEEIVSMYGNDFRRNPIGTGPFVFKYWEEGVKLVFVKNENYFEREDGDPLPYLDAVAITFLIDQQSAFLEFVKGNLDFLSGIDPSYKDELLTSRGELNPKYHDKFHMITQPYLNTEYLGFLVDPAIGNKDDPLKNIAIRKAINYGFDRKKMIKYLRNGIGTPGFYGIIPPGLPGFSSAECLKQEFNPDKARSYLKQAGFDNGEILSGITLSTTSEYLDLCEYIQHQLSEIGIEIEIDVNPPATLRELKAQAKLPFFRASWIADYPDAENYLSLFYGENFCPAGPNYTHYYSSVYDSLFDAAMTQSNDSLRYRNYMKMNQIIMEESPVIILYYDQVLRFVQKNIEGIGSNPINLLSLKRVKKTIN